MRQLVVVLALIISVNSFSQESILDKVAKETCEYLNSEEVKALSVEDKTVKLGFFMITKYNEYETEFKKEGLEFNFSEDSQSGRDFGENLGMQMAEYCPEAIMSLVGDSIEDEEEEIEEVRGELVRITGEEFSSIIVKDEAGKTHKFLWLENFPNSEKLIYSTSIEGVKVKITYRNIECYSPKLQEYILRKTIVGIKFL